MSNIKNSTLLEELSQLREEKNALIEKIIELEKREAHERIENERLKGELSGWITGDMHLPCLDRIDNLKAARDLKDAALDRCQRYHSPNEDDENDGCCIACGANDGRPCEPDCWWQAARKAGQE